MVQKREMKVQIMSNKTLEAILPPGFQDLWGEAIILKKELIRILQENSLKYGYSEIETSPFEFSENIGSFLSDDLNNPMSDIFTFDDKTRKISLIFDLSAPLSRFISAQYSSLTFPFKRFQISQVYRDETTKMGRGRYRSFFQGDFDQIFTGNVPSQANAELCEIINDTLLKFKFKKDQFKISIFNRKIINGLLDDLKINDEIQKFKVLRSIDKYDRLNEAGVRELLKQKRADKISGDVTLGANLSDEQASVILNFLKIKDLETLKLNFKNKISKVGIDELEKVFELLSYGDYFKQYQIDCSKTRGLNYYDSFVVETNLNFKVKNKEQKLVEMGSIVSGGAYSKLCGRFRGGKIYQGTGCSFGISRILYCLMQLNQLKINQNYTVMIACMDDKYMKEYYSIAKNLRENNINTEIYLDPSKNLGKQLLYANKKNCAVALILGTDEYKSSSITLKNLLSKRDEDNQITIPRNPENKLIDEIRKIIPKNN